MTNRHPRARRGARAATVGFVLASALGAAAGGPASAAEEPPPDRPSERPPERVRTARLCDNTVCYVAWRVVDSDHDGVSDADELMAGTDPWDPASRPRPEVVVELAGAERLPSFQAGHGAFVVYPTDIAELQSKRFPNDHGVFAIDTRADALTRLGISKDLMASVGVDPDRDGMTIGIDRPTGDGLPGRRVAGLDVRTISAGGSSDPLPGVQGGGVIGTSRGADGSTTTWFSDGGRTVTRTENGVTTVDRYGPGDTYLGSSSSTGGTTSTDVPGTSTTTTHSDGKGNTTGTTITSSYRLPNGITVTTTEKRTYIRDANGNITGQRVVTTTSVGDGRGGSSTSKVDICNAKGEDCGPPVDHSGSDDDHGDSGDDGDHGDTPTHGGDQDDHGDGDGDGDSNDHDDDAPAHDDPDDDHGYWNPDADAPIVTFEDVDGVLRMQGAAITTVQDWTAPGAEPDFEKKGTLILVDPEQAYAFTVLSEPRVTGAQPEYDPNMPSPFDGAPPPLGGADNCDGLCRMP